MNKIPRQFLVLKLRKDLTSPDPSAFVYRDKMTLLQDIDKFILSGQDKSPRDKCLSEQDTFISDQKAITSDRETIISDQETIISDQETIISDQKTFISDQKSIISDEVNTFISDQKTTVADRRLNFWNRKRDDILIASPNSGSSIPLTPSPPACTLSGCSSRSLLDIEIKAQNRFQLDESIDSPSIPSDLKPKVNRRHLLDRKDLEKSHHESKNENTLTETNQKRKREINRQYHDASLEENIATIDPRKSLVSDVKYADLLPQNKSNCEPGLSEKLNVSLDSNKSFDNLKYAQGDHAESPNQDEYIQKLDTKYFDILEENYKNLKSFNKYWFGHPSEKTETHPSEGTTCAREKTNALGEISTPVVDSNSERACNISLWTHNMASQTLQIATPQSAAKQDRYSDLLQQLSEIKAKHNYLKPLPSPPISRRQEFRSDVRRFLRGEGDCQSRESLGGESRKNGRVLTKDVKVNTEEGSTMLCLNSNVAIDLKNNTGVLRAIPTHHSSASKVATDADASLSQYRRRYESLLLKQYKYKEALIDQKYCRVLRKHVQDEVPEEINWIHGKILNPKYVDQKLSCCKSSRNLVQKNRASVRVEPFASLSKELVVVNYENYDGENAHWRMKREISSHVGRETTDKTVQCSRLEDHLEKKARNTIINHIREEKRSDGNRISRDNGLFKHGESLFNYLKESENSTNFTDKTPAGVKFFENIAVIPPSNANTENLRPLLISNEIDVLFKRQISEYNLMVQAMKKESRDARGDGLASGGHSGLASGQSKVASGQSEFKVVFERIKDMKSKSDRLVQSGANLDFKDQDCAQVSRHSQGFPEFVKKRKDCTNKSIERFQNEIKACCESSRGLKPVTYVNHYDSLVKTEEQRGHGDNAGEVEDNRNSKLGISFKKAASNLLTRESNGRESNQRESNQTHKWMEEHSVYGSENDSPPKGFQKRNIATLNQTFEERYNDIFSKNEEKKHFTLSALNGTPSSGIRTIGTTIPISPCENILEAKEQKASKEKSKLARGITKMFSKKKTIKSKQSMTLKAKPTVTMNNKKQKFWKTGKRKNNSERRRSEQ